MHTYACTCSKHKNTQIDKPIALMCDRSDTVSRISDREKLSCKLCNTVFLERRARTLHTFSVSLVIV